MEMDYNDMESQIDAAVKAKEDAIKQLRRAQVLIKRHMTRFCYFLLRDAIY